MPSNSATIHGPADLDDGPDPQLVSGLTAIADPTRLRILAALRDGHERCRTIEGYVGIHVSDLARQLGMTQLLLGVIAFTAFLAENGWPSWSAPFLERTFDATASLASMGPAAVGLALVVGRFGAQVLASRTDDRTLIAGAVGRGRFRSDVARSWLANTSLFVDASAHRTKLIAHRGVHQVYVGTDRSNDACHAVPVEPIAYGFIKNMIPSMREAFRLGAHVVKTEQHRRGSSRRAGIGAAGPTCLDAFAERLMTPMRDAGGRVVGGLRDPVRVHAPA